MALVHITFSISRFICSQIGARIGGTYMWTANFDWRLAPMDFIKHLNNISFHEGMDTI